MCEIGRTQQYLQRIEGLGGQCAIKSSPLSFIIDYNSRNMPPPDFDGIATGKATIKRGLEGKATLYFTSILNLDCALKKGAELINQHINVTTATQTGREF